MNQVKTRLSKLKNPIKVKILTGFFKTGKGQYGEGDIFWGITVPEQRKVAKEFIDISLNDIQELLIDPVHECRLTGLFILNYQYLKLSKEDDVDSNKKMKNIFDLYIKNIRYINNWDLVDASSPNIIGAYLFDKDRSLLYKLVKSKKLWERRISIVSTFYFIRKNDFSDTLKISELLLEDKHDLIHKAVGWMLREVGKRDEVVLHNFLKKHAHVMPRTALRYSIERLPDDFRRHYMGNS